MYIYIWKVLLNKHIKLMFFIQLLCIVICSLISVYPVVLIRDVVDLAIYGEFKNIKMIISIGSIYLIIQILRAFLTALIKYITKYMQAKISLILEQKIFEHITNVNLQKIKFSDSTQLSNTLVQDTQFISENIVDPFSEFISSLLSFLFGFYFVATINLQLALVVLPLGLISSLIIKWVSKKSYLNISSQRESYTKLWKLFNEGILGFIPLRFHNSVNKYFEKVNTYGVLLQKISITQGQIEGISYFTTSSLFMITIGLIMIISSVFVVMGKITLGGLTAIMMYNHMLSDPLIKLQEINHKIQRLKVSFLRVLEIMNLPLEKVEIGIGINEIELKNVSFNIGDQVILKDINLLISKENSIMITGSTGSGKTTLVNLLTGIYEGTEGNVIFRKNNVVTTIRPKASYMLQDEYIFDDTVYNNILIGNQKLTNDELKTIISICELEDVFLIHNGLVGNNGICLSGGERKRLLIARTIADLQSDIFIFDEMSASLDQTTFIRIWNKVDTYLNNKIRIYIEHNLSIQENVDNIITMNNCNISNNSSNN